MDSTSTKASPKSQVSECTTKIDKGKKLYTDRLDYVHNTLDGRNTRYRFDLEDDIPWLHLAEEGSFVPRELFEKFDIDCNSLDEQPGAYELLQWATGLAICRTFEILETGLIQFCTEQEQSLQQTSSISSLCEEEEKHIQLFRRYARYLEQQQPQHLDAFNRSFDHSITYLTALFAEKQQKTLHGKIWLDSLVFEPFTVYLSAALESANEKIQPVWRQAHRMHAREEAQHILTIGTYYDALNLTKVERQELAADFSAEVARGFDHLFAIAAPLAVVEEVYPDLNLSPREAGKIPCAFAQEICTSRYFKAMRTALPEMATTLKN